MPRVQGGAGEGGDSVSACKTGCGREATENEGRLCDTCNDKWWVSPEWARWDVAMPDAEARRMSALTDFCNRTRAERSVRNNEGTA